MLNPFQKTHFFRSDGAERRGWFLSTMGWSGLGLSGLGWSGLVRRNLGILPVQASEQLTSLEVNHCIELEIRALDEPAPQVRQNQYAEAGVRGDQLLSVTCSAKFSCSRFVRADFSCDVLLHWRPGQLENEVDPVGITEVPDARGSRDPAEVLDNLDWTDSPKQPCRLLRAQVWLLGI